MPRKSDSIVQRESGNVFTFTKPIEEDKKKKTYKKSSLKVMVTPQGPTRNYRKEFKKLLTNNDSLTIVSFGKHKDGTPRHRRKDFQSHPVGRFTSSPTETGTHFPINFSVRQNEKGKIVTNLNSLYPRPNNIAFGAVVNALKGFSNSIELVNASYDVTNYLPMYLKGRNVYPNFRPLPINRKSIQKEIKHYQLYGRNKNYKFYQRAFIRKWQR